MARGGEVDCNVSLSLTTKISPCKEGLGTILLDPLVGESDGM